MSLTTVAELRSALGVGSLYADATLQEVCDASDDVILPFLWRNETFNYAHSNTTTEGTLYFEAEHSFYVGQVVTISHNGSPFNGSKTITGTGTYTITFAVTGSPAETPIHNCVPLGKVAGTTNITYSDQSAVQEASLMIAIAIFQARSAPSGQGMSVDGFVPSPFTMSNTLLARVRGLLAPYLDPRSQVG